MSRSTRLWGTVEVDRWGRVHSTLLLGIGVVLMGWPDRMIALALPALAAVISGNVALLVIRGRGRQWNAADAVTLVRLAAMAFGVLWYDAVGGFVVGAFALTIAAEMLDGVDGWAARRFGGSEVGARLDMEVDAWATLALSVLAVRVAGIGGWVMVAGVLRYAYALVEPLFGPTVFPRWFALQSKSICVVAIAALIVVPLPVRGLAPIASLIAMVGLVYSFGATVVLHLTLRPRASQARSSP